MRYWGDYVFVAVCIVLAFWAGVLKAEDVVWYRTSNPTDVSITIEQVSHNTLIREYKANIGSIPANTRLYGLATLYHNKRKGTWRCEILVWSLSDTETLAHELKHCNGWSHDEGELG